MSLETPRSRARTAVQIAVLILILLAIVLAFYFLKVFNPEPDLPGSITYRVEGSASQAYVTYTQADGADSEREQVILPWKKTIRISETTTVVLTASNPTQVGSIECIIVLDGREWRQESAEIPEDKVSCAGVVK